MTFIFDVYMWRAYVTIITLISGLREKFLRNVALRLILRFLTIIILIPGLREKVSINFAPRSNPSFLEELYVLFFVFGGRVY